MWPRAEGRLLSLDELIKVAEFDLANAKAAWERRKVEQPEETAALLEKRGAGYTNRTLFIYQEIFKKDLALYELRARKKEKEGKAVS
ncbi:MAG: hypothetical protein LiPW39_384 [Parcubacteria group bacterium LiPW_39]|nr:MAG: hypothetical protein LiPW39_384 [Parcubacteria group bacterium LiPW_39]